MAQDIGQVHLFRVYGLRQSRGPYTCKERSRSISRHLNRTSLVNKGFSIWLPGRFFLRDTAGSRERATQLHLARSGSHSQRSIRFVFAHGANLTIVMAGCVWLPKSQRVIIYVFLSLCLMNIQVKESSPFTTLRINKVASVLYKKNKQIDGSSC